MLGTSIITVYVETVYFQCVSVQNYSCLGDSGSEPCQVLHLPKQWWGWVLVLSRDFLLTLFSGWQHTCLICRKYLPQALIMAHQPIVPSFLMVTIVFWKCAWIIILMVPYIYVTFWSLQRAMHTSLVSLKVPLSLICKWGTVTQKGWISTSPHPRWLWIRTQAFQLLFHWFLRIWRDVLYPLMELFYLQTSAQREKSRGR